MHQGKELPASRHITSPELSSLHVLLSPSGQAALANARRHVETFLTSAGVPDPADGAAPIRVSSPSLPIASPRFASAVAGMVPAGDGAAFVERLGGSAAMEAAFVIIPRTILRQLLASLEDLDLRADRTERGMLRTISMAMQARLTTLPRTVAEIRTLVAAVAQDVTDASDVVLDEARELDRIGFALIMALQALYDVERAS